jgi:amino acid transporter
MELPTEPSGSRRSQDSADKMRVIVLGSVMLLFLSYWRVAAVVLCDLASTAYYIGGIVEQSVGPAAPWCILAVLLFSYAVRSMYIESSALFVRGGVYRVVKEAMGGFMAKLSVSALMFDYVLTGPISGVSAGQYIMSLLLEIVAHFTGKTLSPEVATEIRNWGSVAIAFAVTLYFFWQNLIGLRESSGKAVKIMIATTIMGVTILLWCLVTLLVEGPRNALPILPDLRVRLDPHTGQPFSPLGFLQGTQIGDRLSALHGEQWLSAIGAIGLCIAFAHAILAMSGEETLAQVYRETEAPKLANFRKAALVVFVYSLLLTGGVSFLAVLLIPNDVRMAQYSDNLIGGLAMHVIGPIAMRFALHAFVVVVGFLMLAGAVNTAIIGSNGVLNRVAEDGVLHDWFLKPHPRHGTTYRILILIAAMQLFTILVSRGDVLVLGEAYAFGVVWSFVFKAAAMTVLRFKNTTPRDYKVPLNIRFGKYELPIGLLLIFSVLLIAAIMNLLTKPLATEWGLGFTIVFLIAFVISEQYHPQRQKSKGEHLEQFNLHEADEISAESLGLEHEDRKLIVVRSPARLDILDKVLAEIDPLKTDVVVMATKAVPGVVTHVLSPKLNRYDQELMTAVVAKTEKIGKQVAPLVVPTNNRIHAILRTALEIGVKEIILAVEHQADTSGLRQRIISHWQNLSNKPSSPIKLRLLSDQGEESVELARDTPHATP